MRRAAAALTLTLALVALTPARAEDLQWRHRATLGQVSLLANPLGALARASFYEARGFPGGAIRPYAQACGFSFGMLNEGNMAITVPLKSWRAVGADGQEISLRLAEEWDADWATAGIPEAARIAFRWAQFQSANVFEPGDWIMGMATLARVPRPPFRLVARFQDARGKHEIQLDQLRCADD